MARPDFRFRSEISNIRNNGQLYRGHWVHVRIGQSNLSQTLISVRKKFGNAVSRNHIRRQIRSLCRECIPNGHPGQLLIISVGDNSLGVSFSELRQDLSCAFEVLHLI